MLSSNLPTIETAKERYQIAFQDFAIVMFHPVTTEAEFMSGYAKQFVDALLEKPLNYVVIYPNNDMGSNLILFEYERLKNRDNIRIFPSIRFEYFLVLLKYSKFIIGNSSAGIREAPYYGLPTINIGTRQLNRVIHKDIINCGYGVQQIIQSIDKALNLKIEKTAFFGNGNSDLLFLKCLKKESLWEISKQKIFKDI
jgi:UDP-N-acetylglucosamine 2-epimerase (hydrolysing)